MLYLIIAALGFAAAENIILLNGLSMFGATTAEILKITLGRFLGAVFLHALASGIVGYFLARSLFIKPTSQRGKRNGQERKSFIGLGILVATCLHGIYNYIIMEIGPRNEGSIFLLIILLVFMAIIVSRAFKKLNKLKAICKI